MNKRLLNILLISLILGISSCKRIPLYDENNTMSLDLVLRLNINVDIDVSITEGLDIKIPATITPPTYNKVLFYSPSDNSLHYSTFVGTTGGAIFTPPGAYKMLVYSFGTEYIQIRGENDINTIEAYTSDVTATKMKILRSFTRAGETDPPGPIIYAPDHLLVAREDVVIPEWTGESQTITIDALSKTIVESYSFEVSTVVGTEYIQSCEAFVTNQSRSSFFGRGEISTEPATICFEVGVNKTKNCLYTVFNTFGKLPGESVSYLHILIKDTGGTEHRVTVDITDQFEKADHHIIIDEPVVIPTPLPPGGEGGIAPTVDPWSEETTDVGIG